MDISKSISEVNNYFKNKVLSGDYAFVRCDDYLATIVIDGKYEFRLWIENDPKHSFNFYDTNEIFNPELKTQKERIQAWNHMKKHVEKHKKRVLIREKQKKINQLKKEIDSIKL